MPRSSNRPRRTLLLGLACAATLAAAEPADWVVTGRAVILMDARRTVIENGAVAVRGERILAAGPATQVLRDYQPRQRLDRPQALIVPGLVATHTHAPMSLLRGIADDLPLQDWLEKHIFPAEARNVDAAFVRLGTRLAVLEMLLSGTTTYTDMYYFEDVIAEVTSQAGMRGVLGETIIGFAAPDAKTPEAALRFTENFIRRFRGDPLITPAVAPHALYTNTDATLRACRALANRYGVPLLTHLSETRREFEESKARRGVTPTRALDSLGVFTGRTLVAHAVWLDDADIEILKRRDVGVAHCPSSNMKLASGLAPVIRLLALGVRLGLGPDGPAGSNNDFNLLEEMDLAAHLQKVATGEPQALPAVAALEMATIGGARALGMEKEIGSLEPGKRADLITVSLTAPHALPMYNSYSQVVYALKGCDVEDVMVNGRMVVRSRRVLTLDADQILAEVRRFRLR